MGPVPAEEAGNYREDKSQTLFFFNLQYLSSLWLGLELESLGSWPTGMLRIFFSLSSGVAAHCDRFLLLFLDRFWCPVLCMSAVSGFLALWDGSLITEISSESAEVA